MTKMPTDARPVEVKMLTAVSALAAFSNAMLFLPPFGVQQQVYLANLIGESPVMLVGSNLLLLFLWAASGIALFNGKALGWWLAAFLYPHGMFRFGRMFYVESRSASDADPPRLIAHLITIAFFGVLCFFLYRIRVRAWAGLTHWPRRWLIVLPLGAVACFIVLETIARMLLRP